MEDQEIILKEKNTFSIVRLGFIILYSFLCFIVAIVSYNLGCKDTKGIYEEPQIHVTLVPEIGSATVIPLKLTTKGVGIKFNVPVTNLIAIGIDMPKVKK